MRLDRWYEGGWAMFRQCIRGRVLVLGVSSVLVLAALWASQAAASNFSGISGSTGCSGVNVADNRTHTFFYENLTSATSAAVDWTRTNNYNPTDINTQKVATKSSLTDVVAYDGDYEGQTCGTTWCCNTGSGTWGISLCQALNVANECEQDFVYFDTDIMGPATTAWERTLACHEIGHSVGLGQFHRSVHGPGHDDRCC